MLRGKNTSYNKSEEKIRKIGLQCNHRQSNKPSISGRARTKSYNYPNPKYLNKGKWTEAAKSLKRKANPTDRDKYGNKRWKEKLKKIHFNKEMVESINTVLHNHMQRNYQSKMKWSTKNQGPSSICNWQYYQENTWAHTETTSKCKGKMHI